MKMYIEPAVQILFLILSITGAAISSDQYVSVEAWENLYLTNIINAAIAGIYLTARFVLRNKNPLENLQRGMLLFIIYSCLPVFVLITSPVTRILSAVCFAGAFAVFIYKNFQKQNAEDFQNLKGGGRIVFSLLLLLFGAGFLIRGVNVIYQYSAGAAGLTDMLVSISDIIISVVWFAAGIGFLKKNAFGNSNILPCYLQASLLFMGLIAFLFVNPLIVGTAVDIEAVIVIAVMGLLFFIPTAVLLRK